MRVASLERAKEGEGGGGGRIWGPGDVDDADDDRGARGAGGCSSTMTFQPRKSVYCMVDILCVVNSKEVWLYSCRAIHLVRRVEASSGCNHLLRDNG